MPAPISVVIPTLNAALQLGDTCQALLPGLTDGLICELVISDGGSTDETALVAKELGAIRVDGPKGRGAQIARGIEAARGDWVLILHADTHLGDGWQDAVALHMRSAPSQAGWFRLAFRATGIAPWVIATGANLRSRIFGLPYGDQGLLISKKLLHHIGGYPQLPLMEDVALARALKGNLRPLNATAHTSADRFENDGWAKRSLSNLGTLLRYFAGTSPEDLVKRYETKRR